jgi:hypothetical protein
VKARSITLNGALEEESIILRIIGNEDGNGVLWHGLRRLYKILQKIIKTTSIYPTKAAEKAMALADSTECSAQHN